MIIRKDSFLRQRDYPIHEASHFAVGILLNLPMQMPEIFRDGSGGRAPFDIDEAERLCARSPLIFESPDQEMKVMGKAAVRIAAVYLAGCAGEAIHFGMPTDIIIGGRTADMIYAGQVLERAGQPMTKLFDAWELSVKLLKHAWPAVVRAADLIPVTDGTHRAPIFH